MLSQTDALSRYGVVAAAAAASNVGTLPDIARSGLEDMILCKKVLMTPKQVSPSAKVSSPKGSPNESTGTSSLGAASGGMESSQPRSSDRLKQCASPMKRVVARTGATPPSSAASPSSKLNGISRESTEMMSQTMPLRSLSAHDGTSKRDTNIPHPHQLARSVNGMRKSSIPKPANGLRRSMEKISAAAEDPSQVSDFSIPAAAGASRARQMSSKSSPAIDIGSLNLASMGIGVEGSVPRHKSHKTDNDSQSSKSGESMSSGSANSKAVNTLTSNVDAVSFQTACKLRVAKQKKQLAAIVGDKGFSAKEARASIREASAAKAEEAAKRKRAEVYAINRYLGQRESQRYEQFLEEQERQLQEDDVSWCSADSSVMPTPRYRSEKERRYDNTTPTKKQTRAVGGV